MPASSQPPFVIGCHGLLADRRSPKQIALGNALNQIGIAFLRFDHRGCGDSQGGLRHTLSLEARCRDLYHAIGALETYSCLGQLAGLFGSSFGGTVVLATAAKHIVPAIISYAAPIRSSPMPSSATGIQSKNAAVGPRLSVMPFDISGLIDSLSNVLVIHGESDEIVPIDHAKEICHLVGYPKELIIFDKGDHRMGNPSHQMQFITQCQAWISKS
ncbi:MAG: alpha/beta hydrolase [Desulfatitalea sp.]|nr:alpha/beta hydrolase [Desulfatitalea sp.]NNK00985.1 alpha/beta hydrolase [Desulfatitalea sp.]